MAKCVLHAGRGRPPKGCGDCAAGKGQAPARALVAAEVVAEELGRQSAQAPRRPEKPVKAARKIPTSPQTQELITRFLAALSALDSDTKDDLVRVHERSGNSRSLQASIEAMNRALQSCPVGWARHEIAAMNAATDTLKRLACHDSFDYMALYAVVRKAVIAICAEEITAEDRALLLAPVAELLADKSEVKP